VELALISDEMEDYRDRPWEFLSTLRGFYTVVLEVYHETNYSEDEYTKGVDEYAFKLDVDPTMNEKAPVRVIHGGKTYFPTGHLLEESYYDAELKKEVVKQYDGATYRLGELIPDMVTATLHYTGSITPEGALSLYLAPFYELKEITVYDADLNLIVSAEATEPLEIICSWGAGDYYAIISATFAGVAGVFYSFSQYNVPSATFDYNYSIEILVMVVLGGMGSINGSILAAALITTLNDRLASVLTGDLAVLQNLIYALILIAIVIYNNAPALKNFRNKYNLGNLMRKLLRAKAHAGDDAAKWDVVPTKIEMNEVLSVDVVPQSVKEGGKGDE
jgi:hypothetical protein